MKQRMASVVAMKIRGCRGIEGNYIIWRAMIHPETIHVYFTEKATYRQTALESCLKGFEIKFSLRVCEGPQAATACTSNRSRIRSRVKPIPEFRSGSAAK
jgi:hypothetical protein